MGLIIPIILVAICSVVIWRAVDGFSTASEYIGRHLSDGVRGATINAIASSMPELFTTMFFLFYLNDVDGFSGGIGTTAGSAIFNGQIIPAMVILTVVMAGVVKNINVTKKVIKRDGISLIISEFILIILISGNSLYWWHGFGLMMIYVVYIVYMLRTMSKADKSIEYNHLDFYEPKEEHPVKSIFQGGLTIDLERMVLGNKIIKNSNAWPLLIIATLTIAVSCYFLVLACEWIGAETYIVPYLGEFHGLGVPILFIALIIASMASSIPDTIISMKDAKKGNYDDAVSNAFGSNLFDICFALGFPLFLYGLIKGPIHMDEEIIQLTSELRMLLLLMTVVVFIIFMWGSTMGKMKAYLLLFIYLIFVLYVIGRSWGNEFAWNIAQWLRFLVDLIPIRLG